jgi:two-component system, cell cycle sensor histidine kinase and response regulator CckA
MTDPAPSTEQPFFALAAAVNALACVCRPMGEVLWANATFERETGQFARDLGRPDGVGALAHPGDRPSFLEALYGFARSEDRVSGSLEHRYADTRGWAHRVRTVAHKLDWGGEAALLVVASPGPEEDAAREALARSEERFRTLSSMATEGIMIHAGGVVLDANQAFARLVGRGSPADLVGQDGFAALGLTPPSKQAILAHMLSASTGPHEIQMERPDGSLLTAETHGRDVVYLGKRARLILMRDVGQQKAAEVERARLEASLRQAQKVESIGRLAGGIAHDFNNLLTVIVGDATLALSALPEGEVHDLVADVKVAGESAAKLTRQLLAFSRKQLIEPRVVELKDVIPGIVSMLRRLLGEDVELQVRLEEELGRVRIDPGQLEQVLVNLALNARDAMPRGGRLSITVSDVVLDEGFTRRHPPVRPGRFVQLAVADDGAGLTDEVKAHLFEPFFTTKGPGHGTGLGLPMVYGVVTQNGGVIEVSSKFGHGTTVQIYLPRADEAAEAVPPAAPGKKPSRGETILLVEDNDLVRSFAERLLRREGYQVCSFSGGPEALAALEEIPARLDLIVTDVVMPAMNGRSVAERVCAVRPDARVLFTSGYTPDVIVQHGVLEKGVEFLAKPYSEENLLRRVREVLEADGGDAG